MRKIMCMVVFAALVFPGAALADVGFGLGFSFDYIPLISSKMESDNGGDEADLSNETGFGFALEPGINFGGGMLYFPFGLLRTNGRLKFDVYEIDEYGDYDLAGTKKVPYEVTMFRMGVGGGGLFPSRSKFRVVLRGHSDLYFGTLHRDKLEIEGYNIDAWDSDSGVGFGMGFDAAFRYYFSQPSQWGKPRGFFIGAGFTANYTMMSFTYTDYDSDYYSYTDEQISYSSIFLGLTLIHLGFGI